MKQALRILLALVVAGMLLASAGTTQVAADKPKFTGGDNPCQNTNQGNPNCPKQHHKSSIAPLLILAPLGLRGKSLAALYD